MDQNDVDSDKMKLLDTLIDSIEKTKRVRRDDVSSRMLFEIYNMSQNNMSKVLTESALWITPDSASVLLEQGMVQRVLGTGNEKYALTFRGIAECVKLRFGDTLEDQFLKFLEYSDQKFATVEQTPFKWDEKLVSLSLILMASTSSSAAIRLNNETNKIVFRDVFDRVLSSLKNYGILDRGEKLRKVSRGESPVMAVMSRLNSLARKTNHYYKSVVQESAYYFDIEMGEKVDERKLTFVLTRIFQNSPKANFDGLQKDLLEVSRLYAPRFLGRLVNPSSELIILRKMRDFFDRDIYGLITTDQSSSQG